MDHPEPDFGKSDEKYTSKKFKKYFFTDWKREIHFYDQFKCDFLYIIEEAAPSTGNMHWHVYMVLQNLRSWGSIKKAFKGRGKAFITKGTWEQCLKYMTLDGDHTVILDHGEKPKGQGFRTDIQYAREIIKSGEQRCMARVTGEINSYQANRMAQLILSYHERKRDWRPEVYWYWGEAGTGKTHLAKHEAGHDFWISQSGLRWWQDYDGDENVIFDEFRGDWCKYHELLRILDDSPYTVEVKGGSRQLLAKKIWITSEYHPRDVYTTRDNIQQLLRRITKIEHFTVVVQPKWTSGNDCVHCAQEESRSDNGTEVNGSEVGGNNMPLLQIHQDYMI